MLGFRIMKRRRAVALDTASQFLELPVANVSDSMARMTAGGARLRPYYNGGRMAGPAFTVKTRPGDNLMIHKALQLVQAGDVLVVDAGGDLTNALIGEIMVGHAAKIGVAGIIINGAIRDAAELRAGSLPVFAAGVTHRGPYKDGPGEINVPVAIDGMVIEPGDLVLGDDDGILSVPFADVDRILAATRQKQAAEVKMIAEIAAGTYSASWVDDILTRGKCFIETG